MKTTQSLGLCFGLATALFMASCGGDRIPGDPPPNQIASYSMNQLDIATQTSKQFIIELPTGGIEGLVWKLDKIEDENLLKSVSMTSHNNAECCDQLGGVEFLFEAKEPGTTTVQLSAGPNKVLVYHVTITQPMIR